jgi:predicted protein tyrosine phosphatase
MRRVLFVCGRNRWRSPTAEQVFASWPALEVASAGLDSDADVPLSPELLEWADIIFVMEKEHRSKLSKKYGSLLKNQRVVCLDIPDKYRLMDPHLIEILKARVPKFLTEASPNKALERSRNG